MAGPTVTVACKIPNGIEISLPGREPISIRGPAVPWGAPPVDEGTGYALTPGVDEAYYKAWEAANKNADFIKKRFVFAHAKAFDARAESRDMKDEMTKLEPLDPDKPGRGLERLKVGA